MLHPSPPSGMFSPAPATTAQAWCGTMPFIIRNDGTWLYKGTPIRRKELVCLFASILTRDQTGCHVLHTPAERGAIAVEDAAFQAIELDWGLCSGTQTLSFRLNTDQVVTAGPRHPLFMRNGRPYLTVRPGEGAYPLEARLSRPVYYELAALSVAIKLEQDGTESLGVWSGGTFFPLGHLPDAEE